MIQKNEPAAPHWPDLAPEALYGLPGDIVRDIPANEMCETIYYLLSEGRPGLAGGLLNRAEAKRSQRT